MDTSTEDWPALAAAQGREEFVAAHPHPFLLALTGLDAPPPPARTVRMEGGVQLMAALMAERRRMAAGEKFPAVLPIRKIQATFPSMITVGRARNNDIVVPDALVSKFHAFFRQIDADWALADAGSANGTKVGEIGLVPKGPPEKVRAGDRITFGVSAFQFVDAAGLWAALHDPSKPSKPA
jgi:hypothetical protein